MWKMWQHNYWMKPSIMLCNAPHTKIRSDHNSRSFKLIPVLSTGNLFFKIPIVFSTTTRALQSLWLNTAFLISFTITSVGNGVQRKGRSRLKDGYHTVVCQVKIKQNLAWKVAFLSFLVKFGKGSRIVCPMLSQILVKIYA